MHWILYTIPMSIVPRNNMFRKQNPFFDWQSQGLILCSAVNLDGNLNIMLFNYYLLTLARICSVWRLGIGYSSWHTLLTESMWEKTCEWYRGILQDESETALK